MKNFEQNLINEKQSIKDALVKLNALTHKDRLTLFVLNDEKQLVGTITDGDIRRGLIENKSVNDPLSTLMHVSFRYLQHNNFTPEDIRKMKEAEIQLVPLLDENKRIMRVIDLKNKLSVLPLDAVVLAGGKGERLLPLTKDIPKPLLKIGDKPILEHNVDRLKNYGVDNLVISVRHMGEQITDYFGNGDKHNMKISYVNETGEPLGTIGSVGLIEEFLHDHVLIMNSDLLTNIDFESFFRDFVDKKADMIVATIPYNVQIPYAVLETDEERILSFKEKPTYTYYSNAGIYIVKKDLLKMIPKNEFYNATDFMEHLIGKNYKVAYYPILGYWLDIGKHEDYKKAQEDIKRIRL